MNNVRVLSVSTSGYIQAGRVLNRAPGQLCSLCCYVFGEVCVLPDGCQQHKA